MKDYPADQRQGCQFAIRYLKWLCESGAANEIGPDAVAVLVAVVTREDDIYYTRPPNFFNGQLCERSGIGSIPALIRARTRAVEAGLLHYSPGRKRTPGRYFVSGFCNESLPKAEGKRNETVTLHTPTLTYTPNTSKIRFAEVDRELSQFVWEGVQRITPKAKPPNVDKWANTVRLMRERDDRSPEEIRRVFSWANGHDFWAANILSPAKLREKFDQLAAQMQRDGRKSSGGDERPPTDLRAEVARRKADYERRLAAERGAAS